MAIELWEHQLRAGKLLREQQFSALWWSPRTGKTLSATEGSNDGDRLIVCPNSVKPVWQKDLSLYGEGSFIWDRKKLPSERPKNVIINYESLWRTELLGWNWDTVIFDESHRLANMNTKLWRYVYAHLQDLCTGRVILLSGTPCPEGWHQLITQSIVATGQFCGHTDPWEALREGWIYDGDKYKWEEQEGTAKKAKKQLHEIGYAMTQAEAGVLTKKLYRTIQVPVGKHELALWKEALETEPEGAQYGMLAQSCASGRSIDGVTKSSTKLDAVVEYIQELGKPVVILTKFTETLEYISKKLEQVGVKVGKIHGKDGGAVYRGQIVEQFNLGRIRAIVAQVMTVKVGMNLSHSDTLIFPENDFSGEARIQAEERCTVKGKDAVEIIDFWSSCDLPGLGDVDQAVYMSVRGKKDFNSSSLRK
jgi:SNF2 family DNA or RNA helicase